MIAPREAPALPAWRRLAGWIDFNLRRLGVVQAWFLLGLARVSLSWRGRRLADLTGGQADRIAAGLGRLKGPFAKLGQLASLRVDLLSPPVREALAELRSRVPPLPFAWIRRVLEQDLGPLAEIFEAVELEPLGAASMAQAHRARLRDGREVVVKVQYPWLGASAGVDLALVRVLLHRLAAGASPAALDAFAEGYGQELDFRSEAAAATEIAANLADEPQVVVPTVVPEASSARVLTVVHHPAVPVDDPAGLAALGVDPAEVLEVIARAYARQIFVDGLFHADPHPGNLFVIDEPGAASRPRVLFVDFGLSHRLSDELRAELRQGIYSLLQQDLPGFLAGMGRMGMIAPGAQAGVEHSVSAMFERLRAEGSPLGLQSERVLALKDEAKALLYETPGLELPPDLLLYARTVTYLFGLGQEIAPQVDLMKLSVPYLLKFLAAAPR